MGGGGVEWEKAAAAAAVEAPSISADASATALKHLYMHYIYGLWCSICAKWLIVVGYFVLRLARRRDNHRRKMKSQPIWPQKNAKSFFAPVTKREKNADKNKNIASHSMGYR